MSYQLLMDGHLDYILNRRFQPNDHDMESLLPQLLAFPPHPPPPVPLSDAEYDKQIKATLHLLNTIPASKLLAGVPGGGDLLDIIDPSINTLPYLYVLIAEITGSGGKQKAGNISDAFKPGTALWQRTLEFMERFDPIQVRYGGNELRRLVDLTAGKARRISDPETAIAPIRSAILRLDPAGSTFTSSHLIFARICLEAQAYPEALPVLNKDIFYFPPTANKAGENNMFPFLCSNHDTSSTFMTPDSGLSAKLDYRDHLQYFLYGAMIYMGLKEWKRALFFLEIAIITPAMNNASKIQVEAYRKWVLVNLLYKGRSASMPKTTNTQAAKHYHALGRAYDILAEVFENSLKEGETNQRLIAEANQGIQIWSGDYNSGLVRQVIDAYRQFSVLQLEKTFAALTVANIARKTSPDPNDYAETGQYILHLISTGKLNATISEPSEDPASWIVRFSDPTSGPLARSEEQQYEALVKQTRKVKILTDHIRETDRKLSLSKDYIHDAKKKRREKADGADEGNSWMGQDTAFDHDEDMMADL